MTEADNLKEEGLTLFRDGLYSEAISSFERAHALYEQAGDTLNAAEMLNNLGVIHREESNLEEATSYLQQAAAAFEEAGDITRQGQTLGNLALVYKKLKRIDEAEETYERSAQLLLEADEPALRGEVLMALGLMQFNQGKRMAGVANYDAGVQTIDNPTMRQKAVRTLLKLRNSLPGT